MSPDLSQIEASLFVRYFTQYEVNFRAFVASLLYDWDGVDEVIQATSLVMWRKFDQFDTESPESSFLNWAFMIARFEVMKFRSKQAKDRLVLSDGVYELLAEEAEESAAQRSPKSRAGSVFARYAATVEQTDWTIHRSGPRLEYNRLKPN